MPPAPGVLGALCCAQSRERRQPGSSVLLHKAGNEDFSDIPETDLTVIIRVLSAELEQNVGVFGYADLFATIEWVSADGSAWVVARTPTLWMGSTSPEWQFECPGQHYSRQPSAVRAASTGDRLVFQVMQEHYGGLGTPSCLGHASVPVEELLSTGKAGEDLFRPRKELSLSLGDEVVGTITVQVKAEVLTRASGRKPTGQASPSVSASSLKDDFPESGSSGPRTETAKNRCQELMRLLRTTAKKYPRPGRPFFGVSVSVVEQAFRIAKDRFFVITGPKGAKVTDDVFDKLELSWYEDQETWKEKSEPLDSIPLSAIDSAQVQTAGSGSSEHVVVIALVGREETRMEILFSSADQANAWSSHLNEFLGNL